MADHSPSSPRSFPSGKPSIMIEEALSDSSPLLPVQRRANGLSPPYSRHSLCALALVIILMFGVVVASRLPPFPTPPIVSVAFRIWEFDAVLWLPILSWLLLMDPGADRPQHQETAETCKFGCVVASAPRMKHCRRCDKCVEGFDHHCLWLNTCVGKKNYRPWLVFVLLLFVWAALGSGISWLGFLRSIPVRSRRLSVGSRPVALATGLTTFIAAAWLLLLLGLQVYFAIRGISTLQWVKDHDRRLHRSQSCDICSSHSSLLVPAVPTQLSVEVRHRFTGSVVPATPSTTPAAGANPVIVYRKGAAKSKAALLTHLKPSASMSSMPSEMSMSSAPFTWRRLISMSSVEIDGASVGGG